MWIFVGGVAHLQLLDVGVDRDEVDLRDAGVDHAVDRVQAGAADADDADDREVRRAVAGALEARGLLGQRVEPARERAGPRRVGSGSGSGAGATARIGVGSGRRGCSAARRRRDRRGSVGSSCCSSPPSFALPLCRLGRAEELRERALTHAGAISGH